MPRPLILAVIAALCLASHALAIDKTPAAMKRVIDKAVSEVKRNRQDFDKANQAPLEDAREELQDLAKKFIEEGKTEEAQTVLRQVKTLDADVLRLAKAPDPVEAGPGRAPAQKPLLERMAGTWTNANSGLMYYFESDGTFHENRKTDGSVHSHGRIEVLSEDTADIRLSNHHRLRVFNLGKNALGLLVWTPEGVLGGDGIVLERVK